jgi:hypothetical protein
MANVRIVLMHSSSMDILSNEPPLIESVSDAASIAIPASLMLSTVTPGEGFDRVRRRTEPACVGV